MCPLDAAPLKGRHLEFAATDSEKPGILPACAKSTTPFLLTVTQQAHSFIVILFQTYSNLQVLKLQYTTAEVTTRPLKCPNTHMWLEECLTKLKTISVRSLFLFTLQ